MKKVHILAIIPLLTLWSTLLTMKKPDPEKNCVLQLIKSHDYPGKPEHPWAIEKHGVLRDYINHSRISEDTFKKLLALDGIRSGNQDPDVLQVLYDPNYVQITRRSKPKQKVILSDRAFAGLFEECKYVELRNKKNKLFIIFKRKLPKASDSGQRKEVSFFTLFDPEKSESSSSSSSSSNNINEYDSFSSEELRPYNINDWICTNEEISLIISLPGNDKQNKLALNKEELRLLEESLKNKKDVEIQGFTLSTSEQNIHHQVLNVHINKILNVKPNTSPTAHKISLRAQIYYLIAGISLGAIVASIALYVAEKKEYGDKFFASEFLDTLMNRFLRCIASK
jgi:hypothetical protein